MTTSELIDLIYRLFAANTYSEDNKLFIRSALKYDIHNLLEEIAPDKLRILYDELAYDPLEDDNEISDAQVTC